MEYLQLDTTLNDLKTREDAKNPHKAWDYARAVNNICMGYAAGYLTQEEADKRVAEILPLAQKKFKTWDEYMKDFNEGRKIWNPDDQSGNTQLQSITDELLQDSQGIYKQLPLN